MPQTRLQNCNQEQQTAYIFLQNKRLFEANWHSLAQIEGDCITPIFLIIEKVGKKRRFSLIPLTFILTRTSSQLLANWGATSQINADS